MGFSSKVNFEPGEIDEGIDGSLRSELSIDWSSCGFLNTNNIEAEERNVGLRRTRVTMGLFSESEIECLHCGSRNHASEDCPHDEGPFGIVILRECDYCGSTEHATDYCSPDGSSLLGIGATTECEYCGSSDHASRKCPRPGRFLGIVSKCDYCGNEEHVKESCPYLKM